MEERSETSWFRSILGTGEGDWGGSPIRLYPAFLGARDDPTGTTAWSALGSSKHLSPRKMLFKKSIKKH